MTETNYGPETVEPEEEPEVTEPEPESEEPPKQEYKGGPYMPDTNVEPPEPILTETGLPPMQEEQASS